MTQGPDAGARRIRRDDRSTHSARLVMPARPESVRLARLLATSIATDAGFSVHEVDDVRIAVNELCTAMVEMTPVSDLRVEFHRFGTELCVEISIPPTTVVRTGGMHDATRELMLAAVCDDYRLDPEASDVWFVKCARPAPDSSERSP